MRKRNYIITAAGGNGTAIEILDQPLVRAAYVSRGKELGQRTAALGAEQVGFLVLPDKHLEMAGGEFCGNASRSAAILLSLATGETTVAFTISGYCGVVRARVENIQGGHFDVTAYFDRLPIDCRLRALTNGSQVTIVDLGGIVHVVIEGPFPSPANKYECCHRAIVSELNLQHRSAVGVIWITRETGGVIMHPVVWVRDIDTFFYEQSCGSGTIAVARVTGVNSVRQPTGHYISAHPNKNCVVLRSRMEVIQEK